MKTQFLLFAFMLISIIAGAQSRNIMMAFEVQEVNFLTRKVEISIRARNVDVSAVNFGTVSVRFTYDHALYSNPVVTFTGTFYPQTITEQFSPVLQAVVTSYGILALSGPHLVLPPNSGWVPFGKFTLDMAPSVTPQSPLNVNFQAGPGYSATPTVAQEFISFVNQPNLNIIEFGNLNAPLQNFMPAGPPLVGTGGGVSNDPGRTKGTRGGSRMANERNDFETYSPKVTLNTYPNPTTEGVTLALEETGEQVLSYRLFNLDGSSQVFGDITTAETYLPLANAGHYMVQIINANGEVIESKRVIRLD